MTNKKWVLTFFSLLLAVLALAAGLTAGVDPYFHYHKPLKGLNYYFDKDSQRYVNDGILRHFDYDAILIGTSMTENFKASEFDALFGVHSVKVPLRGASYKEVNDYLERAIRRHGGITTVIRVLDYSKIMEAPDTMRYDADSYPDYLYDDFLPNDVKYLFNKSVLLGPVVDVFQQTASGKPTTDFDTYSNWMEGSTFGKKAMKKEYIRPAKVNDVISMSEEDFENETASLTQNVTALAQQHPEIQFYLFFPPYSIYYWDGVNQKGELPRRLEAERLAIETLLEYDNIKLFSFTDEFDMICDVNNYKDETHYSEEINSRMLEWMSRGEHQLTAENYAEYCTKVSDFLRNYDYDALFAKSKSTK